MVRYFKGKDAKQRAFPRFTVGFRRRHRLSVSKYSPHWEIVFSVLTQLVDTRPSQELPQPALTGLGHSGPCSATDMGALLLPHSLSPLRGGTSLHPPRPPAETLHNLPFQNNVQLEEVGSHIALFFGKEKTGSFYLHRKGSEELPSAEKKQKIFQKRKGFDSPSTTHLQERVLSFDSDDVALRDCPQPKLLRPWQFRTPSEVCASRRRSVLARKGERAEQQQLRGAPPATQHPVPGEDAAAPAVSAQHGQALHWCWLGAPGDTTPRPVATAPAAGQHWAWTRLSLLPSLRFFLPKTFQMSACALSHNSTGTQKRTYFFLTQEIGRSDCWAIS